MKKRYLKCLSLSIITIMLVATGIGCSNDQAKPSENIGNHSNNSTLEESIYTSSKEDPQNDTNKLNNSGINLFNMILPNDNSIYTLNNDLENIKIYNSDLNLSISTIRYLENSKGYIILENFNSQDQEYEMYFINSDGEKTLIANNIFEEYFKDFVIEYENSLYYLTGDSDLYCFNEKTNENIKIESNVILFSITDNGDLIIRTDNELYITNSNNEKVILSTSNKGEFYYYTDKKNKVVFFEENLIYCYDIAKNSSKVIEETNTSILTDDNISDYSLKFNDTDGFVYSVSFEYEHVNNKLKYNDYKNNSIVIDYNICDFSLAKDGIYYTKYSEEFLAFYNNIENEYANDFYGDYYDGLYYFDFSTNKSTKIYDCERLIETTNINSDMAYIADSDNNVSMISNNGTIKKSYGTINQDYEIYQDKDLDTYIKYVPYTPILFKNYTVILSMDGNLYFDDFKVASNVKFVLSFKDSLAYITNDNKIYLIEDNEIPQLIIKDATKYDKIYFYGRLLYVN